MLYIVLAFIGILSATVLFKLLSLLVGMALSMLGVIAVFGLLLFIVSAWLMAAVPHEDRY